MTFKKKKIILFFGPPGSGKTTQALRLKKKYKDHDYISWGSITRSILKKERYQEYYNIVKNVMENDDFFPENFIVNIIKKEILDSDKEYIILDGFPKHFSEAKEISRKN